MTVGQKILKANGFYLMFFAVGGLVMDIAGVFFGAGPEARIVHPVVTGWPPEGVGFIEAHGLALILGSAFWRLPSRRGWHLTAAATGVLLGTSNLVFWNIFTAAQILAAGYITTSLHWIFAILQIGAAVTAESRKELARTLA